MTEKKDTDLTSGEYRPKVKVNSKFVVAPKKVAPTDLTTVEE